jgi:transposase
MDVEEIFNKDFVNFCRIHTVNDISKRYDIEKKIIRYFIKMFDLDYLKNGTLKERFKKLSKDENFLKFCKEHVLSEIFEEYFTKDGMKFKYRTFLVHMLDSNIEHLLVVGRPKKKDKNRFDSKYNTQEMKEYLQTHEMKEITAKLNISRQYAYYVCTKLGVRPKRPDYSYFSKVNKEEFKQFSKDHTITEIAEKYNITENYCRRILDKYSIAFKPLLVKNVIHDIDRFIEYSMSHSISDTAKEFGVHPNTVMRYNVKYKVERPGRIRNTK